MIEVRVVQATKDMHFNKNGTFVAGNLYFMRQGKNGDCFVALSEEEHWTLISTDNKIYISNRQPENFKLKQVIYMKNRKRLNFIFGVSDYLESNDHIKFPYHMLKFADKELMRVYDGGLWLRKE